MMYYGVGDVTDQSCKTDLVLPTPTQLAVTDFVISTLRRTRGWEGVDATTPPPPIRFFRVFSCRINHQHLTFSVAVRSSLAQILRQV